MQCKNHFSCGFRIPIQVAHPSPPLVIVVNESSSFYRLLCYGFDVHGGGAFRNAPRVSIASWSKPMVRMAIDEPATSQPVSQLQGTGSIHKQPTGHVFVLTDLQSIPNNATLCRLHDQIFTLFATLSLAAALKIIRHYSNPGIEHN